MHLALIPSLPFFSERKFHDVQETEYILLLASILHFCRIVHRLSPLLCRNSCISYHILIQKLNLEIADIFSLFMITLVMGRLFDTITMIKI